MTDAGQLKITLHCRRELIRVYNLSVRQVSIQSTRPLHISRFFIRKTPAQTLATLPLLFNVCGVAQAFASHTALSQALGLPENSAATLARQLLLNVEVIREHCWWLLIDCDKAKLVPFLNFVKQFKQALFVNGDAFSLTSQLQIDNVQLDFLIKQLEKNLDVIFAEQRLTFLAVQNDADLEQWLKNNSSIPAQLLQDLITKQQQSLGRSLLNLLPVLSEPELQQQLNQVNADDFIRHPTWQNQCYESSCLNRQQLQPLIVDLLQHYGNGLLTRLASRLLELANLPNLIRENFKGLQICRSDTFAYSGIGLAQVQASRGLLIHRVQLKHGMIANYQIVAPTEWNFHPQGIAALSLQQLTADNTETLHQQAAQVIQAIDPCVGFELVIESK